MCLALPGQIQAIDGFYAQVRIGKTKRLVLNATKAKTGDWVLIENGIASETISSKESELMAIAWNQTARKKKKPRK